MSGTVVSRKASAAKACPKTKGPVRNVSKVPMQKSLTQEKIMAGVTVAAGTMLAHPLAAEAAVTPSLKNLLNSVVAGGFVLTAIFGAISLVAQFDPVSRRS
jgi:hypothetical protein